jgi:glycosyltransferase involved in cell wall biosynthesis
MDQHGGGVLVYTRNLLRELLKLDTPHEFVLMYRSPRHLGTYGDDDRVREVAMGAPSVVLWDQVAVPLLARRQKVDLIFNPKYSVPLFAHCPSVFVCHGLPWYVEPRWSPWADRLSHRYLIPRYAAKAAKIIAVSNTTREHVVDYLSVPPERVETVYMGISESFAEPIEKTRLEEVRRQYGLPERYFLYCGQIYPPKNFGRLLQAYARVGPELGIRLVVAGEHRLLCENEVALIDELGINDMVVSTGWLDHATLPVIYRLADALLLPSLYEAFGFPLLEAMAVGCPVVTSDRFATRELAEGVGVLVDPEDVGSIARGVRQAALDIDTRQSSIEAGQRRAAKFSWEKCARETVAVLQRAVAATV